MANQLNASPGGKKKPDLVKQQLERIRKIRPSIKAGSNTHADSGSDQSTNPNSKRQVDEYVNRDAAARKGAPRDPVTLGDAVDGMIQANDWGKKAELATVMTNWREIIGAEFAEHVKPIGFEADESILILQADSTSWATQTRILSVEILQKIDQQAGSGVVKSLEIKGPEPVRKPRGKYRVKGRGPRDTYG